MNETIREDTARDLGSFYEEDAGRHNIWTASKRSFLYFKEVLRYDRIVGAIPRGARRVLDAGCGDGYVSVLLARRGHEVTALDLSRKRLDKFADKAKQLGIRQVQGSALETGLPAGSVDAVILSEVVEHLPEPEAALAEAHRVLSPGGLLIVSVPNEEDIPQVVCPHCRKSFNTDGHLHSFSAATLSAMLADAELEPRQAVTFRNRRTERVRGGLVHLPYGAWVRGMDALFSRLWPRLNKFLMVAARKAQ